MTTEQFLALIGNVKRQGNQWTGCCPGHDDHRNSLSIKKGDDGRTLLKCHAGCTIQQITNTLGISVSDLYENPSAPFHTGPSKPRQIEAYDYVDEHGRLLYQNVRYEPKQFSQRRPDGQGGWIYNIEGIRRVPYRLPKLLNADPVVYLFLAEGERDVHNLEQYGCVASSHKNWRQEFNRFVLGRHIVILRDHDKPGIVQAEQAARLLYGEAASLKMIDFFENEPLPEKHGKDVSDWLPMQKDPRKALLDLVEAAPEWMPDQEKCSTNSTKSPLGDGKQGNIVELVEEIPGNSQSQEWEPLIPLSDLNLPSFPISAFPPSFRNMVECEAQAKETPVDMQAMIALGMLSVVLTGKVYVQIRQDWREPAVLYVAIVAASGENKTGSLAAFRSPVVRYEAQMRERLGEERARKQVDHDILAARLADTKKRATGAKTPQERSEMTELAQCIAVELRRFQVPTEFALLADDVTPEALAEVMFHQNGCLSIVKDEGDVLITAAGRYNEGIANLGIYKNGYDGERVKIQRKKQEDLDIPAAYLSLLLMFQPSVLEELAKHKAMTEEGFLPRFCWSLPQNSRLGYRDHWQLPTPQVVRQTYESNITRLLELPLRKADDGNPYPYTVHLSDEAQEILRAFFARMEAMLPEGELLGNIQAWANKQRGRCARIAALLHMAEHVNEEQPWKIPIQAETMSRAVQIADYLIPHALAVFGEMRLDPTLADVRHLARWGQRWVQKKQTLRFSQKQAQMENHSRFPTSDSLIAPLRAGCDRGFIKEIPVIDRRSAGRPKSPTFEINPALISSEILQLIQLNSPITLRLNEMQWGEVHRATAIRQKNKKNAPKSHSNGSTAEDYTVTLFGTGFEFALVNWSRGRGLPAHDWVLASEGAAPEGADFTIDGVRFEMKATTPGKDCVHISIEQHNDPTREADYYLFGHWIDRETVQVYGPVPYNQIEQHEVCKGIAYNDENGNTIRRPDYYRLPISALQPLISIEQITALLSANPTEAPSTLEHAIWTEEVYFVEGEDLPFPIDGDIPGEADEPVSPEQLNGLFEE